MKSKIADENELLSAIQTGLPPAQRILAFAPHPDDEIFGCGGLLALLRNQSCSVSIIVVTDGAAGGGNAAGDLVRIRADESRSAAGVLGLPTPIFWGLPDRGLAYGELLIERVEAAITEAGADLVLLPSPTELHPDHQALALAGAEALRRLGGNRQVAFYEINAPLPNPNLMIDITPVFEQKRAAMACFSSQLEEQPYDQRIEGLNRFRSYFLGPQAVAAEAYVMLDVASIQPGFAPLFDGPLAHRRRLGVAVGGEDLPLVSVLIRSMDRPTLVEALDSVALQTWSNIEVVVVNAKGGMHSDVGDRCGRFPLRLVNQGGEPLSRPKAANLGLDNVVSRYVSFLDDDDTIAPEHLQVLVAALMRKEAPAVAYAGVVCRRRVDPAEHALCRFVDPFVDFPRLLLGNLVPIHAALFPAALLGTEIRFDENLPVYEDWDFWLQLALRIPFIYVDRVSAIYYADGDSGVSFGEAGQDGKRAAAQAVYAKWLPRLKPGHWAGVVAHYERRSLALHEAQMQKEQCLKEQADLHLEIGHLNEAVRHSRHELQALYKEQADLHLEIGHLNEVVRHFRHELQALYRSSSWRMTAPCRYVGQLLRKVRGGDGE